MYCDHLLFTEMVKEGSPALKQYQRAKHKTQNCSDLTAVLQPTISTV